jgi:hypothetical protein
MNIINDKDLLNQSCFLEKPGKCDIFKETRTMWYTILYSLFSSASAGGEYASAGGSVENLRFPVNELYLHLYVRHKLPLPRKPSGVIPKEVANLYWVAKLQGDVER